MALDPLTVLTILFGGVGGTFLAILYQQLREYRGLRQEFGGLGNELRGYAARIEGHIGEQKVFNDRALKILERLAPGPGA